MPRKRANTHPYQKTLNRRFGRERATLTNRINDKFNDRGYWMVQARKRKAELDTYGPELVSSAVALARLYNRQALECRRQRDQFDATESPVQLDP